MPLDDTQVELILQAAQTVAIGINQRNIIVLADEVFRQRAADLAGAGCLLLSSLTGVPVSTTHTRTAALLGAGSTSGRRIDWSVARSIALTWVLTVPGCFTLGWCMARLFLAWV